MKAPIKRFVGTIGQTRTWCSGNYGTRIKVEVLACVVGIDSPVLLAYVDCDFLLRPTLLAPVGPALTVHIHIPFNIATEKNPGLV